MAKSKTGAPKGVTEIITPVSSAALIKERSKKTHRSIQNKHDPELAESVDKPENNHPLNTTRVMICLTIFAISAVGIGLMPAQYFGIGWALSYIAAVLSIWVIIHEYSSAKKIEIFICAMLVAIELIIPPYLFFVRPSDNNKTKSDSGTSPVITALKSLNNAKIITRNLYTSTQIIRLTFGRHDNFDVEKMNIDNAIILHAIPPYSPDSITILADSVVKKIPDVDFGGEKISNQSEELFDKNQIFSFDRYVNVRHKINAGDRVFNVALSEISTQIYLDKPTIYYTFIISEE